jgi:hypothetical protein
MCRLAATVGVEPHRFTLAELVEMAEARSSAEWGRVWGILAQLANTCRDPKRRPLDPLKYCPHKDPYDGAREPTEEDREMLRQMYPAKKA